MSGKATRWGSLIRTMSFTIGGNDVSSAKEWYKETWIFVSLFKG